MTVDRELNGWVIEDTYDGITRWERNGVVEAVKDETDEVVQRWIRSEDTVYVPGLGFYVSQDDFEGAQVAYNALPYHNL